MNPFEAHNLPNGDIQIFTDDWKHSFLLDSKEGFGFAQKYVQDMKRKYPFHVTAVELKIKKDNPERSEQMMKNAMLYTKNVAQVSLSCVFGCLDHVFDRDKYGRFRFEFVPCPCRKTCRFNGYNPALKDSTLVICNPIIHLELTKTEAEIATLLIEGVLSLTRIAELRHVTVSAVMQMASAIYKKAGVANRKELAFLFENQRLK